MNNNKNLWILGPKDKKFSGIGLYSLNLLKGLNDKGYEDDIINIPFKSRTILRYLYQFIYLPFYLLLFSHRYQNVILYEEAYSFLIPFCDLCRKKSILIFHHVPEGNSGDSVIEKLKYIYMRMILSLTTSAKKIVFPSEFSRAEYLKVFPMGRTNIKNRYIVIPNSFDFPAEIINSNDRVIENEKDNLSFLYVGSEEARKNVNTAVEALTKLDVKPKIKFTKIGKAIVTENRKKLSSILLHSSLDYQLFDFVNKEELEHYLSTCDFFIMPSLHEGFGRTPIEAQHYGKLVISSDIPVLREIMGDSAIYVQQPNLVSSWVNVLQEVIQFDIETLQIYKNKAKKNSARYTIENVTDRFIANVLREEE
ncbi:TPA: glycosyltransferase [Klebsiella pneumoniae]